MRESDMMRYKVVFSIVSHNHDHHLIKLIRTCEENLNISKCNLVVVISHNIGNPKEYYSKKFKIINRYCLNPKGFGDNHNIVFENYDSDYFFVMNPDLIVAEKVNLHDMLSDMDSKGADISSPIILNEDGTKADYRRGKLTPFTILKRLLPGSKSNDDFQWFCGMCLIFKSSAFRKLKGFDPRFFMYVEDCDICLRGQKLDMSIEDIEDVRIIHLAQRGSRKSLKLLMFHLKSLIRFWLNI